MLYYASQDGKIQTKQSSSIISESQDYVVIPLTEVAFGPCDSIRGKILNLSCVTSVLPTHIRNTHFILIHNQNQITPSKVLLYF